MVIAMEPLYRGSQLLAKRRALEQEPLAAKVRDRLRPQTRETMDNATRGAWMPVDVDLDLTAVMWDVLGEQGVRRVCGRSVVDSLNGPLLGPLAQGTLRLFGVSPRHFYRMVPRGWSQVYRNAGHVEYFGGEGDCLQLHYSDLPDCFFTRGYLEGIAGGLEGLLLFQRVPGRVLLSQRDREFGSMKIDVEWSLDQRRAKAN